MSIKQEPNKLSNQTIKMAKQSSSSTSAAAPAVASSSSSAPSQKPKTPKPAAAAAPQAASASAPSKPKVVKASKPADASTASSDSAHQNVAVASSSSSQESSLFAGSHSKLQTLVSALASLRSELRGIERQVERELRVARKASEKKRRKNINRQPSGFVKPTLISNELATFLGKSSGSEMARTEVTREINAYIRDNKLQDKDNGRRILPDAKLKKLLKLKDGDELTYFNLQRFMSPHFAKTAVSGGAAVAAK
jgi:chromatin remodeling complex protein RSC6